MTTKYAPLSSYLLSLKSDEWRASFADVERVLGFPLPRSARDYQAWWANETEGRSPHQHAWLHVGWRAEELNLVAERIIFRRVGQSQSAALLRGKSNRDRSLPKVAPLSRQDAEPEAVCAVRFAWVPLGQAALDTAGKLVFPRPPSLPGLYRFTLDIDERRTVYIGEADNLARRFQHYRTPGPRQETNVRINALMSQLIGQGGQVLVAMIVDAVMVRTGDVERLCDLSTKAERVLVEHAALLLSRVPGVLIANK